MEDLDIPKPRQRAGFKIVVICALKAEADAVEASFDHYWDDEISFGKAVGDLNTYSTGRINHHDVVLAWLPGIGKGAAASAASSIRSSFQNIELALVVGICGGVPTSEDGTHRRLGDVVISRGVVQYDFGRKYPDRFFRIDTLESNLGRPSSEIRALLNKIEGVRGIKRLRENTREYLAGLLADESFKHAVFPGIHQDRLFQSAYRHKHQDPLKCVLCASCDADDGQVCKQSEVSSCSALECNDEYRVHREVPTSRGDSANPNPSIFFGTIATGDTVMKSGLDRDRIATQEDIIAFEMEGAGVWDNFPCIVIKGICDYADSHKDKIWQPYAALTAAACAKAFLKEWPRSFPAGDSATVSRSRRPADSFSPSRLSQGGSTFSGSNSGIQIGNVGGNFSNSGE